jgi:hypothetical protein
MDEADRASDLIVRQLCDKAAAATSKEEADTALQELRDTIHDSMDRARERLKKIAVLEITENKSKAAD